MAIDARIEALVGAALLQRGWTICAAESCTGGLVLHRLTNIAGSSAYVLGGVVAYANAVKQDLLGVQEATLRHFGAVSEQTAAEMARGAQTRIGAQVAVSVTGIAGPGGGSAEKPVGLAYVGVALPDGRVMVRRHMATGDREAIKVASAEAALKLVLQALEGEAT